MKLALESGVGAPDVFTGEIAFLKQWIDTGYWENLSEEPYNAEEVSKDIVPYIFDLGKDKDGNVRALSWQTTPGGSYYKRSIVKEGGKETETEVISYVREHLEAVSDWNAEGLKHSRLLPLVAHG